MASGVTILGIRIPNDTNYGLNCAICHGSFLPRPHRGRIAKPRFGVGVRGPIPGKERLQTEIATIRSSVHFQAEVTAEKREAFLSMAMIVLRTRVQDKAMSIYENLK